MVTRLIVVTTKSLRCIPETNIIHVLYVNSTLIQKLFFIVITEAGIHMTFRIFNIKKGKKKFLSLQSHFV